MKTPRYNDKGMYLFHHLLQYMQWNFNITDEWIEPKYRKDGELGFMEWFVANYAITTHSNIDNPLDDDDPNKYILMIHRISNGRVDYNIATIAVKEVMKGKVMYYHFTMEINRFMKLYKYETFALKRLNSILERENNFLKLEPKIIEYANIFKKSVIDFKNRVNDLWRRK